MRHKINRDRAINVPVNCTVGPSGARAQICPANLNHYAHVCTDYGYL